ncbi:hypothetical protein KKH56_04435 [bacterium]|nr:hypothetical protein [bacterium]
MVTLGDKRKLFDFIFSELAILLTPILGGISIYLVTKVSWKFFPAILVSLIPFGLGCMGLSRLSEWSERKNN